MSETVLTPQAPTFPLPSHLKESARAAESGVADYDTIARLHDYVTASLGSIGIDPGSVLFSGYNPSSLKRGGLEEDDAYYFGNETSIHPETNPDPDDPGVIVNPLIFAAKYGVLGVYDMMSIGRLCEQGKMQLSKRLSRFGIWYVGIQFRRPQ